MFIFIRVLLMHLSSPWRDMTEEYTLLLKSARRCAYDLSHAAWGPTTPDMSDMFERRARMWLNIFSPDGMKDYRHRLHNDIDKLEFRIQRLRDFCVKNDLDPEEVDDTQF